MLTTPAAMAARLATGDRLLGLDPGRKTIGLAISDPGRRVASPLFTLRRSKFRADAARLAALAGERGVGGLVIGFPRNMDGSEGPRCQATRDFARLLGPILNLPIAAWDERLSTVAVTRVLVEEADLTRRKRQAAIDKMAAAYILQGCLDFLASHPDHRTGH